MTDVEGLNQENARLKQELAALRSQIHSASDNKQVGRLGAPGPLLSQSAANGAPDACTSCMLRRPSASAGKRAHASRQQQLQRVPADKPQQQLQLSGESLSPSRSAENSSDSSGSSRAFQSQYDMSKAQVERYSRQLLLPSFGIAAQAKLCSSSILIVGCGGLGSPAALYLAAAGVGRLGLVDHDVVELSNMHRQVIHTEQRIGMHKAESAAAAVQALNSGVCIDLHVDGLLPSNAVDIISQYDVVIDASDNPPTRYLINDACVACGVPLVSAAAVGTDGQLTVYNYAGGPCYRCLFPECPAAANCSRCADAGVLGPVPGVMGVLQATEAIKVISGVGQVLAGKLLLYDALAGRFTTIKLRGKAPSCVACGDHALISKASVASYDYTTFTGGQRPNDGPPVPLAVLPPQQRITAQQLQKQLTTASAPAGGGNSAAADDSSDSSSLQQPLLLDVRPPEQFAVMSVPGAVNIPYLQFDQRFDEVLQLCGTQPTTTAENADAANTGSDEAVGAAAAAASGGGEVAEAGRRVFVMCRRGNHSQLAVERLRAAGVCGAVDVVGGYEAWAAQVDSGMPTL